MIGSDDLGQCEYLQRRCWINFRMDSVIPIHPGAVMVR
jgi:hypothetical protein